MGNIELSRFPIFKTLISWEKLINAQGIQMRKAADHDSKSIALLQL